MSYKILKITRFYTNFLTKIYTENKELQNLEYLKQYSFLMKQFLLKYKIKQCFRFYLYERGFFPFIID